MSMGCIFIRKQNNTKFNFGCNNFQVLSQLHISKLRALKAEGQLFKVTCKDEIEGKMQNCSNKVPHNRTSCFKIIYMKLFLWLHISFATESLLQVA